jgi:hypothetical protein
MALAVLKPLRAAHRAAATNKQAARA